MIQAAQPKTEGFIAKIGSQHGFYNDATLLFPFKNITLLAMFDISTTKPLPKELLVLAFQNTLDSALDQPDFTATETATFTLLQQYLQALNAVIKVGSTSIAVAWVDASKAWGYSAGDVRMGVISGKELVWLSPVHTGANIDAQFTDEHKQHPQRHILTRVLRPHRPFSPEGFEFAIPAGQQFIAATDGFWCDPSWCTWLTLTDNAEVQPLDDCTCCWFTPSEFASARHLSLQHEHLILNTKYQNITIGT